jgi:hypothetical protein
LWIHVTLHAYNNHLSVYVYWQGKDNGDRNIFAN